MNMKVPMDKRVPQIYRDAQFRVDKSCVKTPLPTLPRCVITYRHLFSRIQMKTFHEVTVIGILCLCLWHTGSTTHCHPLPPANGKGHDTCGTGTTRVGSWSVVALHGWILWTRTVREAAFIYISTAGRAARRGHPASITDTAVLGLQQQSSHHIFKTVKTVKEKGRRSSFYKVSFKLQRESFQSITWFAHSVLLYKVWW